jgi:hypothetical protein
VTTNSPTLRFSRTVEYYVKYCPSYSQTIFDFLVNELETIFQTYQEDNQVILAYDCMVHYGQLA